MHVHVTSCSAQGTSNVTNDRPSNEWIHVKGELWVSYLPMREHFAGGAGVFCLKGCEKTWPLMDAPQFLLPQTLQPCVLRYTESAPWLEFGAFLVETILFKLGFWCFTHYLSRQVVWPAFSNLTLSEVHSYSGRDVCHVPANFIMQ